MWEHRSNAFPSYYTPALMCCLWHIKLLFMHSITKKYNQIIIVKNVEISLPKFLRFCLNFWQIKTFGSALARLQHQLLHRWIAIYSSSLCNNKLVRIWISLLLHLKKKYRNCLNPSNDLRMALRNCMCQGISG